ncbi:MotA/TolQ/ExbB proton channel family protein [Fulvivirga sedimenti]|uniref:MotA/TolQ/ExbB proton channel family protein n=1 Tax=Fulvivirga sedimenti TaxID=2879465 RepID=A0A9X1HQE8_9BACT|nr:MotA/TolQ/ExbB proton channel family protein [Fulvivirga sedimenti]MCA6074332.1 MotA/TolQ/ExbB proton channel family protein [Fulvivirga sedimenti]
MFDLFNEGGPLFMGLLTIEFILVIVVAVRTMIKYSGDALSYAEAQKTLGYVRSLGLLAFVTGIFGQLIGLYDAFTAIQEIESVSPAMLAGGLRVSLITTLYGTFILMISLILWMVLDNRLKSKSVE